MNVFIRLPWFLISVHFRKSIRVTLHSVTYVNVLPVHWPFDCIELALVRSYSGSGLQAITTQINFWQPWNCSNHRYYYVPWRRYVHRAKKHIPETAMANEIMKRHYVVRELKKAPEDEKRRVVASVR